MTECTGVAYLDLSFAGLTKGVPYVRNVLTLMRQPLDRDEVSAMVGLRV